jgi:hypothetical protein
LGLFIGALGLDRTYLMSASPDLHLHSDLQGLTWLPYRKREDDNMREAVNGATLGIMARPGLIGHGTRDGERSPTQPSGRIAP